MSDPFDGLSSADTQTSQLTDRDRKALDAVFADMAALPSTVPDADQPLHITAQAVREENAIAATIGADVAAAHGAVVRETNVLRKRADGAVDGIMGELSQIIARAEQIGARRMLRFVNVRTIRLSNGDTVNAAAFRRLAEEAYENADGIASGEVKP